MRFGCCLPGASFVPQMNGDPPAQGALSLLTRNIDTVFALGYDFAELTVGTVTDMPQAEFDGLAAFLAGRGYTIEAFNSFIPPRIPLTGPAVDWDGVTAYLELSATRLSAIGAKVVVFGSGAARRIPDGYDRAKADAQILRFLGLCQSIMAARGITVCIEPLNSKETNCITSVAEGLALCQKAGLPDVKLLADCYHMDADGEDFCVIAKAAPYLRHVHISDSRRVPPGLPCEDGIDFAAFFGELKKSGYAGGISAECPFNDLSSDAAVTLKFARAAWEKA